MRVNKIIKIYQKHGAHLIPLAIKGGPKERGKKALHKGYQTRNYGYDELKRYADGGHNIGWVLGEQDLVIDIDPRNGGHESYKDLVEEFEIDLAILAPCVESGRGDGGKHFYFRIPEGTNPRRLWSSLDSLPGVDFKHHKGIVVTAGSVHAETKGLYRFDEISPFAEEPPMLPAWLLKRLDKNRDKDTGKKKRSVELSEEPDLTLKELKKMLNQLPVENYNHNDKWLPLMFASHYATHGEGLEVFTDWSTSDPSYTDHEDLIETRWESASFDDPDPVKTATLYSEVLKYGGTIPGSVRAKEQFKDLLKKGHVELDDEEVIEETLEDKKTLRERIDNLDTYSKSNEVNEILRELKQVNLVARGMAMRDIATNTKVPLPVLRKQLKTISESQGEDDTYEDLYEAVAKKVLAEHYKRGKHLVYGLDDHFWYYDETHWKRQTGGLLHRDIYRSFRRYRKKNEIEIPIPQLLTPVEKTLKALVADNDNLGMQRFCKPVINCANGEIWIDEDTGEYRFEKHDSSEKLTTCLEDVIFKEGSECPLFKKSLLEIFQPCEDRRDVVRHFFEFLGYIVQPNKNIASWWLLYGRGSNGKTVVLDILSAMLGEAALERDLRDFTGNDNHAMATLPGKLAVIDDDLETKICLPDSFLKKISENKNVYGNPKHSMGDRFRSSACIILASNEMPRMKDLSDGLRRRAMFFPFLRTFKKHEQNKNLSKDIIKNELSGVLNEALKGLIRLRKRGYFRVPRSCENMTKQWELESNPLLEFLNIRVNKDDEGSSIGLKELWIIYDLWCAENEIKPDYRFHVRSFAKEIRALGVETKRSSGGKIVVLDVSLRDEDEIEESLFDDLLNEYEI